MTYRYTKYSRASIRTARNFIDCYGPDSYQAAVAMDQGRAVVEILHRLYGPSRERFAALNR